MIHEVALLRTKGSSVFNSVMHALVDTHEKRLISSSDFIQLKCHEEPTLNPWEKY